MIMIILDVVVGFWVICKIIQIIEQIKDLKKGEKNES